MTSLSRWMPNSNVPSPDGGRSSQTISIVISNSSVVMVAPLVLPMVEFFAMKLKILPLTPELWPALEDLFGEKGACNGCWCMYWRIGAAYRGRPGSKNKAAFRQVVKNGP